MTTINPIHAGEHLKEFIEEFEITQYRLSKDINVPPRRINEIVKGLRGVSVDTAIRLGKYFGNSPQFWLNLQTSYEIELSETKGLDLIVPIVNAGQDSESIEPD